MKQILIFAAVIVAVLGGAILLGKDDEAAAGVPSDNWYGQEQGIVTVTEYADFECPACANFYPIITQIKEDFKDQIRFELVNFPLVQIHPNATAAHRAANAAAKQGSFWEMHDLLYERQTSWRASGAVNASGAPITTNNPTAIFEEYARELNLDMEKYIADAASSESLATINADVEMGKALGANSTPTFFIDGVLVENTGAISSVAGFSEVIQAAIDAKNGSSETSTDANAPTPTQEPATVPENSNQ